MDNNVLQNIFYVMDANFICLKHFHRRENVLKKEPRYGVSVTFDSDIQTRKEILTTDVSDLHRRLISQISLKL